MTATTPEEDAPVGEHLQRGDELVGELVKHEGVAAAEPLLDKLSVTDSSVQPRLLLKDLVQVAETDEEPAGEDAEPPVESRHPPQVAAETDEQHTMKSCVDLAHAFTLD